MNKTTKSKTSTVKNAKAALFLIVFMCCSIVTFGQFKINPNTTFTVKNVVSSKEEVNSFDSSILGENEVVLNGNNQHLETAAATSLPTLRIANANELTIHTELHLRGNLVVQSGVLKLQNPVHIDGELILEDDALIVNEHLITYKNKYVFNKSVTGPGAFEVGPASTAWIVISQEERIEMELTPIKSIIISNDFIKNQYILFPFSPPPERAPHA